MTSAASPDALKYAHFYPNLCGVTQHVKVGGRTTCASHDHATVSHERRHFIDRDFLASLEGGQTLFLQLAAPQPPCQGLAGTRTEAPLHVFGMLAHPLPVSVQAGGPGRQLNYRPSSPDENSTIDIQLTNVLVVDRLPVPLHISWRCLLEHWPRDKDGVGFYYGPGEPMLSKDRFPSSYHRHPYWRDFNNQ